jgi:hypothetical protein
MTMKREIVKIDEEKYKRVGIRGEVLESSRLSAYV